MILENGSRLTCDEVAKRDFLSTNQSKRNNTEYETPASTGW